MFYGDNTAWIAFANTLKLRLLMRQTQMSGRDAYISGEIAKIVANGGGFLDVDAAVNPGRQSGSTPGYANNDGQQNPLWGFFVTLTNTATSGGGADLYRANAYAISVLQSYNDPRLGLIYDVNNANAFVGSVLGGQFNPPGGGTSPAVGAGLLKSVSQPSMILSAAESHFLQAEAIVRGYLTGDAKAEYEAGVQASFDFLGAGSAATYLSSGNPGTDWSKALPGGVQAEIALIIGQKWIAMDGVTPNEAYADYRRLHLPNIPLSISPYLAQGAVIPTRYLYPVSEYTTNGANVSQEGTIDYYTSKVFWNQ